jgi:RNA polymerase sigma-70 factor (ECF subfamily)
MAIAAPLADFSAFYAEHAERVLVFLARRCLDPELAVDLMAETFAQAYASRGRFRGSTGEEAVAWLFAIARHQLSAYFRRGRARDKALRRLRMRVPAAPPDELMRIDELAGLAELRGVVRERFDALPHAQRAALRLRIVEERPYHEVAEALDVSEPAARARVSRGLRRLASALERAPRARERQP